ncbi:hypothetical protein H1P_1410007 [Hyella patelloides LEGE 07179]|uniref:Uncharacterized protein n=1 Tax=Hyella patelloides LEGE 07179 TaxID=945734 RepID=A0A563VLJ9_9CYAN|nr:hypothetical protein [Hyella patelloides]VEP12292.1 hypothetical protein H1P_1410007 [Hyella patelloides LEGE 07179]
MNQVIETVVSSLKNLLGSTVKILPGVITALVIVMLTSSVFLQSR